jgi:hypothetical protein
VGVGFSTDDAVENVNHRLVLARLDFGQSFASVHRPERANTAELDALRDTLQAALRDSTPTRTKAVLQAMIDGIRVDARDHIEPTFRIPAVRIDHGDMGETARRANHALVAAPAVVLA